MASGGARSRSGPAPDPNALRRDRKDDAAGWTTLDPAARVGKEPPTWPLLGQSEREAELWVSFWQKPQAVIWLRDRLVETVGLFVRQFAEGELPRSSAENRKTIRMWTADLYLTADSLARAHIRIGEPASAEKARARARSSARDRILTAVPDVDAAE